MKITKKLLREIIEQEVKGLLSEQPTETVQNIIDTLQDLAAALPDGVITSNNQPVALENLTPEMVLKDPKLRKVIETHIRGIYMEVARLQRLAPQGKF